MKKLIMLTTMLTMTWGSDVIIKSAGTDASNGVVITNSNDVVLVDIDGDGLMTAKKNLAIENGSTGPGKITLFEDSDNGSNSVSIQAGSISADVTFTLPTADGSDGQFLKTNGSGTLSWTSASGSGASAVNDLSDALVEYNSLYLGSDPSGTTDIARDNTSLGIDALSSITTGDDNTAVGKDALKANTTGEYNTSLGSGALESNTTAGGNTAVGERALTSNTTGGYNTALGFLSLLSNTTGRYNVAIGKDALRYNTTGEFNAAVGYSALLENTEGDYNVSVGYQTLEANTTGSSNIAVGNKSLTSNTTASNNIAIGKHSLYYNTTGENNVAIGKDAGGSNATGSSNVFIGYNSGSNSNYQTTSNKLVIANSNTTTPLIDGDFNDATLKVNGSIEATGGILSMNMSVNSTITSNATFNGTATIIPVNTSGGAVTITIDSDQKVAGRILIFKSLSSSNQFTLATEGSEQIQGRSSNLEDTFDTNTGYQTVHLFCDGSNWYDLNY